MQSLSSVADKDMKLNDQFKELTRKKRAYWDKQPVILPENLQDSMTKSNEEDKAKPIVLQKKQDTPKDEVPLPAIFEFGISDLDNEDH